MQLGRRIARLRASHGESLREAAVRTGVSHTTLARIEKGEVTGSFHSTLRKIADGYGVKVEYLLTGRDPQREFEQAIRSLAPDERNKLFFASARTRVKMVLDFLTMEYPDAFSVELMAESIGLTADAFQGLMEQGETDPLAEKSIERLAEALSQMTGISQHWFRWGALGGEQTELIPKETVSAYVDLMKKAAKNGIPPRTLDMAIDLLIMKNKEHVD